MKNTHEWKSGNRLDSMMNILLIVLALGVLGFGASEFDTSAALAANVALYLA